MRRLLGVCLLLLAGGCATSPASRTGPILAWPQAVVDFTTNEQALAVADAFPNSSGMHRRRLAVALETNDAALGQDAVRRLAAMGATLSARTRTQITPALGADTLASLAPVFEANAAPLGTSSLHSTIPVEHRLIEGLIWDPDKRKLYATSVVDRRLLVLDGQSGASIVAEGGLGSLSGGVYDPVRKRIWIASQVIEQTPKDGPLFNGLLSIDATDYRRQTRIPIPDGSGATLGDVTIARDGTAYASDGQKGGVFRCLPGCAKLETWLPSGTFRSSQGMVLSADQKYLYVADYRYGLAVAERATGRVFKIAAPTDMMLDGIDALVRHSRDLIAVQNGIGPLRIVRLILSADGMRIDRLEVLERANPSWGEPSLGVVVGDRLLYVADPQWERYGEGGVAAADKPVRPTPVRSLQLPPSSR